MTQQFEDGKVVCATTKTPCSRQFLYVVRHGDRWDYENKEWAKSTSRPGDPPLSALGQQQASETGVFLDSLLAQDRVSLDNVTWLSSPFLRTLQTSDIAISALKKVSAFPSTTKLPNFKILAEYSVFEWDGKEGFWHASLPPLEERKHYFPRLDLSYESLFVPDIPEPRAAFHSRCEKAIRSIHQRFPYRPQTALVIVTHAAACIGLCKAATRRQLHDITPAAPCSVYRLTRTSDTQHVWDLDPHDAENSMNGHSAHLSNLGVHTIPWNNFGDKSVSKGYTGPTTSRFAPDEVLDLDESK